MKSRTIWKISVLTSPEAEEAVSELLFRCFDSPPSAYANAETGRTTVSVYCDSKPAGLAGKRTQLQAGLRRAGQCGLTVAPARISVKPIRREDWAESWKRHFKPMEIGKALLIKPSWSRRKPRRNQAMVVIDPGLSFGTGNHATTEFCLRELVRHRRAGEGQAFLDIGTGSGILSLAAAGLGYSPVEAFDFDPEAVRIARANARANHLFSQVKISQDDVANLPSRPTRYYDLICANLISNLLIAQRRLIIRQLSAQGKLVLAGILKTEFSEVQKSFETLGLCLISSRSKKEWHSGTFCRR